MIYSTYNQLYLINNFFKWLIIKVLLITLEMKLQETGFCASILHLDC